MLERSPKKIWFRVVALALALLLSVHEWSAYAQTSKSTIPLSASIGNQDEESRSRYDTLLDAMSHRFLASEILPALQDQLSQSGFGAEEIDADQDEDEEEPDLYEKVFRQETDYENEWVDEESGKSRLMAFLSSLLEEDNGHIEELGENLRAFTMESGEDGRILFGIVNARRAYIDIKGLPAGTEIEVIPQFTGLDYLGKPVARLDLTFLDGIHLEFQITMKSPGFFKDRFGFDSYAVSKYVSALVHKKGRKIHVPPRVISVFDEPEDFEMDEAKIPTPEETSKQLRPIYTRLHPGKRIFFGNIARVDEISGAGISGSMLVIELADVEAETLISVRPKLFDEKDPERGAYLEVEPMGGKIRYFVIIPQDPYFIERESPHIQSLFDYIRAVSKKTRPDLEAETRSLGSFSMKANHPGGILLGNIGEEIVEINLPGVSLGDEIKFSFLPVDKDNLSEGARLVVTLPAGKKNLYDILGKAPFFRRRMPSQNEIRQYVEALIAGDDLEQAARSVKSFSHTVQPGNRLVFGLINGKEIFARSAKLEAGQTVKVIPMFIDPERPSLGIQLKVEKANGEVLYFEFVTEPNFLKPLDKLSHAARRDVGRMIEEELDGLGPNAFFLSTRYSVDVKNIVWGIVGSRLHGQYDRAMVEKVIDEKILATIDRETEVQRVKLVDHAKAETGLLEKPRYFESPEVPHREISRVAREINRRIEKSIQEKGLRDMARLQAKAFIRKLEERHFFKRYYQSTPGKDVGVEALDAIDILIRDEEEPMVKEVLYDLRREIEQALIVQEKLRAKGLAKETHLNLYQLTAVYRMHEKRKMLLADEMGLGKTLETLSTFIASDANEMLVLAPKAALSRWMEDIADHLDTDLEVVILSRETAIPKLLSRPRVQVKEFDNSTARYRYLVDRTPPSGRRRIILMNYESLPEFSKYRTTTRSNGDIPLRVEFLALDETHLLKKKDAQTAQAIFGILDKSAQAIGEGNSRPAVKYKGGIEADYKILMSGTPLENKPQDLFNYLQYIARGGKSDAEKFLEAVEAEHFGKTFSKTDLTTLSMLHSYLSERMIRRLKDDVVSGLPRKKFIRVWLDPMTGMMVTDTGESTSLGKTYADHLAMYETALYDPAGFEHRFVKRVPKPAEDDEEDASETNYDLRRPYGDLDAHRPPSFIRLEQAAIDPGIFDQMMSSIKFDAALKITRARASAGKSVLIFTNYRTAARRLRDKMTEEFGGENVAYVDGTVINTPGQAKRNVEVEHFQNKKARIMIVTVGTMGQAVQLTQADTILFLNYPWKDSTLSQAIDRAHRIDPARNFPGKELEIMMLELDVPISIDKEKALLVWRKKILSEMVVNGNLTQEILDAFHDTEKRLISLIETKNEKPVAFDAYELTVLEKFRLKLGEILHTKDPKRVQELWDEVSQIYMQILEHKSSFFANMASLDYLSEYEFVRPRRERQKLQALDLASGPSTLHRSYEKKRPVFEERGLFLTITDYDVSAGMLGLGVDRPQGRVLGSMDDLDQIFESDQFDLVNLSYGFRYAAKPAALIRNIHRVLRHGGLFALILPQSNVIPPRFFDALKEAGFDVTVGQGEKLHSFLDDETYAHLVRQYGQEFADDLAKQAKGKFTYLVANKRRPINRELKDDDFRIASTLPPFNREKTRNLMRTSGPFKIIPLEGTVEGRVVHYNDFLIDSSENDKAEPSEAEYDNGQSNFVRKITRILSTISKSSQSYASRKATSSRLHAKQKDLHENITSKIDELEQEITDRVDSLTLENREEIADKIHALVERKDVRRSLSGQDTERLWNLIALLLVEKELSPDDESAAEIASPMESYSTEDIEPAIAASPPVKEITSHKPTFQEVRRLLENEDEPAEKVLEIIENKALDGEYKKIPQLLEDISIYVFAYLDFWVGSENSENSQSVENKAWDLIRQAVALAVNKHQGNLLALAHDIVEMAKEAVAAPDILIFLEKRYAGNVASGFGFTNAEWTHGKTLLITSNHLEAKYAILHMPEKFKEWLYGRVSRVVILWEGDLASAERLQKELGDVLHVTNTFALDDKNLLNEKQVPGLYSQEIFHFGDSSSLPPPLRRLESKFDSTVSVYLIWEAQRRMAEFAKAA